MSNKESLSINKLSPDAQPSSNNQEMPPNEGIARSEDQHDINTTIVSLRLRRVLRLDFVTCIIIGAFLRLTLFTLRLAFIQSLNASYIPSINVSLCIRFDRVHHFGVLFYLYSCTQHELRGGISEPRCAENALPMCDRCKRLGGGSSHPTRLGRCLPMHS
jgi:hypothetical protein